MLPGSRARRLVAAALGLVASMAITLPASAAPTAEPVGAAQVASPEESLLSSVLAVLDSRAQHVPDSVTSWYVDPATDSVVVTATDDQSARVFAAGQPNVRIKHVDSRPVPTAALRGGYLRGGDQISTVNGKICSIGFNAVSRQNNSRYIVTAGHCTPSRETWYGADGSPIGQAVASSFPRNDYGLIEVLSSAWQQTGTVGSPSSGYFPVTGVTSVRVGDRVCRFGAITAYGCGSVDAVNVRANYGNGDVVYGLVQTNACSMEGDSGGPFMKGRKALGVLSGGNPQEPNACRRGTGYTFYQPIGEVLDKYNLDLLGSPNDD